MGTGRNVSIRLTANLSHLFIGTVTGEAGWVPARIERIRRIQNVDRKMMSAVAPHHGAGFPSIADKRLYIAAFQISLSNPEIVFREKTTPLLYGFFRWLITCVVQCVHLKRSPSKSAHFLETGYLLWGVEKRNRLELSNNSIQENAATCNISILGKTRRSSRFFPISGRSFFPLESPCVPSLYLL